MASSPGGFQGRRVVTGVGANGRSTIVEDEDTSTRSNTPGWITCDVWQIDAFPPNVKDDNTLVPGDSVMYAPSGGIVWRVSTFPPDSEWDAATQSGESLGGLGAAEALAADGDIPGMHATETVDVVTIISGEIYAVLEDGETLLRPGDTIIQRGTKHTWNNRTDKPCVLVAAMIPSVR